MQSNKPIAIVILVALLFAGLHVVGQLTGSGIGPRKDGSKLSSLDHTLPQLPDAPSGDNGPGSPEQAWVSASAANKKAAQKSITAQLDAFKQDDYFKATFYQSAGLRTHFRDVASFRSMMLSAYPQFARYKSVVYGAARQNPAADTVMVEATVTGKDGVVQHAIYTMVKEDSVYRVASVAGGQFAPAISRRNELSL
jgi:hypothetical protein